MKIAYIVNWDLSRETGVSKKIITQISVWTSLGNYVRLFSTSPDKKIWKELDNLDIEIVCSKRILTNLFMVQKLVRKVLSWSPDIVYLRFHLYYPLLNHMMNKIPTFVEINTDDIAEIKLLQPWYEYLYHRISRELIMKRAQGFVLVTKELKNNFLKYNKPILITGNGINLSQYPDLPVTENANPRLVFIGTEGQPWHGVDKIIWLAKYFPKWHFDLIGIKQDSLKIKVPQNIRFHGYLSRYHYEKIMEKADVAIGTLSLHKKNMNEACPIKVREYLAYGIATIIGYNDTDFPHKIPFILKLPNREDNVMENTSLISDFVKRWKGKRVKRKEIEHLDVNLKEKQKLLFFRQSIHG